MTRFGNQNKIRKPNKIRETKQNSGNKQNPRQDPKVAGDKYRNLKTFYSVCLTPVFVIGTPKFQDWVAISIKS